MENTTWYYVDLMERPGGTPLTWRNRPSGYSGDFKEDYGALQMALKRRHRRRVVRWPLAFSDAPAASRGVWFWFGWCLYRGSHETPTEPALGARAAGPMPGSADSRNRGHRANQFYVPVWQSLTISWRMGDRNTSG